MRYTKLRYTYEASLFSAYHLGVPVSPHAHGLVDGPRGEVVSVGVESHHVHVLLVSREDPDGVHVFDVPQFDGTVH